MRAGKRSHPRRKPLLRLPPLPRRPPPKRPAVPSRREGPLREAARSSTRGPVGATALLGCCDRRRRRRGGDLHRPHGPARGAARPGWGGRGESAPRTHGDGLPHPARSAGRARGVRARRRPMNGRAASRGYLVEEFLQALTAQLDRAQDALALKVTGTDRPLTWALKDLNIDLRVFVQIDPESGAVLIQSAGPNEDGASTLHLNLTTITRPMVEENALAFHADSDPRPVSDIGVAAHLDEEHQRKLDWMGIRTVGQLKQLDPHTVQAVIG